MEVNLKKQNIYPKSDGFSPSSRTSYSFPFLQIQDEKQKSIYACNTFINLFFDQTYIELLEQDCYYRYEGLFDVYCQKIYKYKLYSNWDDIKKYFYETIAKDYNITCHWDEFYIPESPNYNLYHTDKECLIYGFDTNEQFFNVLSINNCRIMRYAVTSCQLFFSLTYLHEDECSFCFTRFNSKASASINLHPEKIRNDIFDYLNSSCKYLYFPNSTQKFGIQAMLHFCNYVNDKIQQCQFFDIDNVFVFLDHKKLFYQRLVILEEYALITNDRWPQRYLPILKMAEEFKDFYINFSKIASIKRKNKFSNMSYNINNLVYAEEELLYDLTTKGLMQ